MEIGQVEAVEEFDGVIGGPIVGHNEFPRLAK